MTCDLEDGPNMADGHLGRPWTTEPSPFTDSLPAERPPPIQRGTREYQGVIKALDNYITPAVCALGCLGNVLNLAVLNRQKFRRSDGGKDSGAHIGLMYLAVSDMLFCVTLFPRFLLTSHKSVFDGKNFLLYYQMYGTGLITTFILTSTWIMVAMATMRYLAICYPLKVRTLDGPVFTKVMYTGVFGVCLLVNMPSFWQYKVMEIDLGHICYLVDIGYLDTRQARGQAFLWVRVIIGTFIPAIILVFCNMSLIRALQRSYRMRQQYHVNQNISRSKNRITLMLVSIVTIFVVFVFPCELMEFFPEVVRQNKHKTELFLLVRSIANLLQAVNFAFNFLLYCAINVYFRSAVVEMVTCSRCDIDRNDFVYRRTSSRGTLMTRHLSSFSRNVSLQHKAPATEPTDQTTFMQQPPKCAVVTWNGK